MSRKKDVEIKKKLEELLKYYREFEQELWLLMKKFENTQLLEMQYQRLIGKVEMLEELKKILKGVEDE